VKLLRVLQEQCFERVGGERRVRVDVRLISATNQNLRKLVERGRFRRDLYYRLCVIPITAPPLRQRPRDIPLLVEHFLEQIAAETGRPPRRVASKVIDLLCRYRWPGNVRELRNVVEYANVKCKELTITEKHLPVEVCCVSDPASAYRTSHPGPRPKLTPEDVSLALARAEGNRSLAAKILGVGRTTLYRFLADNERL
jgi:transcriptional regulator with PAS, ATPase and Fis domain